ncbi:MAG: cation:proton antiporter [Gammaproteobacteria bacterium]|nr:cation:proton antiporter [Gammaproteobacteria bacterium]MDH5727678.1 cation:proton antiporter [Gammaproteobacteria bacterium]
MHLDPIMPYLVGAVFAVLAMGLLLRSLHQPHVVGYLLVGVTLGPHGFALINDEVILSRLGSIGVVMLLFFIGMEVSPKKLVQNWKVAFIGTLFQILISVACVWPLGLYLDWPQERIILIGFVISLSSTAVVLKLLQEWNEFNSRVGQNVLVILLAQDLAIIPMLIILSMMGPSVENTATIGLQMLGAIFICVILGYIAFKETIHLPLSKLLKNDHEMQVFAALSICLGLALLTGLLGLSTALGAFVGGIIIGAARETQWVHQSLESFRVVFVALFFVSIGLLVNLSFVVEHWPQILSLVVLVILSNTLINGAILRVLGESWRESLYAGTLLSQIGEFSFVLAAVGIQAKIISEYGYQLTVAVISITLLFSPAWIMLIKALIKRGKPPTRSINRIS